MSRSSTALTAAAVGLVLAAYGARPQESARRRGDGGAAGRATERTLDIAGEDVTHDDTTGKGNASNVVVTDSDGTVFRAKKLAWDNKAKLAHATGDLAMTDPQADATSDAADIQYARAKRIAVLTGSVHITLKPKAASETPAPSVPEPAPVKVENGKATVASQDDEETAQSARRYPMEITCDKVEYHYARDAKTAVLTGSFQAVQKLSDKTRTLRAERADWFGREDRVLLHGPVHVEDTKGMKGDTDGNVTVFTKEGSEGIKFDKGHIIFPVEDEDETSPGAKPAVPPATGTTPGQPTDPAKAKPAPGTGTPPKQARLRAGRKV